MKKLIRYIRYLEKCKILVLEFIILIITKYAIVVNLTNSKLNIPVIRVIVFKDLVYRRFQKQIVLFSNK